MAPVLRSDSTAILQHFLWVVTDLKADDVICKSLERYGVTILPDLLDLDREDIKALDYVDEDEDNTITPLHRGGQGRIRVMQAYVRYLSEEEIDDIQSLDHHDFNAFRMDIYDPNEQPTPSPMKPKKSSPSTDIRQPADDFKKSIKRDKTQYKVFKEDKQWDNWRRTTIATARSHGCEDVFNPSYIPSSTEDLNLFEEKQKFIYSVFNDCLQTDMGKSLVRLHESDYDAHEIYKKLLAHATTSTQATIDSNELLSYLTSTKLNKTQWRGTHHAFVLHWCDQLRKYEDLMDKKDHFSNNVKMVMLQNAVAGVSALHNVKIQAAHDVAHGKSPLNYDSYKVLLLSAATVEDERLSFSRQRPQRTINFHQQDQHDVHFSEMGSPPDVDLFFDIDTDISSLDINVTDRANKAPYKAPFRPSMTRDQWNSLSAEEKTIWDSFSPQAKATILGFRKPSPKPSLQQKINLHDITAADYLCLLHNQSQDTNAPDDNSTSSKTSDNEQSDPKPEDTDTTSSNNENGNLLAYATKQSLPPGDLRRVLSSTSTKKRSSTVSKSLSTPSTPTVTHANTITLNGKTYRQVNVHERLQYNVSATKSSSYGSLIDRGANGGLAGSDVRIVHKHISPRLVDVSGIDSHQVTDLPIVTVGGVVPSQRGNVIAIMHQYAYLGEGKTIHSSGQLEWFKNDVNDKSLKVAGGLQRIKTQDGYGHPVDIKNGLPYIPMRPYTDDEWEDLPHVEWTSDVNWDPSVLDQTITDNDTWFDAVSDLEHLVIYNPFDEFGNFKSREAELHFFDVGEMSASGDYGELQNGETLVGEMPDDIDDIIDRVSNVTFACELQRKYTSPSDDTSGHSSSNDVENPNTLTMCPTSIKAQKRDYESLRPFFLHQSADVIKRTFEATTQYARTNIGSLQLKKTFKTPFAACNVHRRNEAVATDTVFADVPAVDDGSTAAQLFVGRESLVTDVYGVKTEKQFVNTLEDNIRKRGAMDKLISDRAQVEISDRVNSILRGYVIDSWQSEPHYQHQNFAERRYSTIKPLVNTLLNLCGAPAYCWLLALTYVCFVLNHTAVGSLHWRTPIEQLTGSTPDISAILCFRFWEPIYYKLDDSEFPSQSTEKRGYFVGISEHVGHALTFKILTDDTKKIIHRSRIRSALDPKERNLRIDLAIDDSAPQVVKSKHDEDLKEGKQMPTFEPTDLIGRTFLLPPEEDGQRFRGKIIESIFENEEELNNQPERIKFRCSVNDEQFEEILSYNEILDMIEKDDTEDGLWRFKSITGHQGPLSKSDSAYKGSRYNVLVNWETGESTYEPLHIIAADDPVSCAIYAKKNDLLDKEGWKRFKRLARRQKKIVRLMNQAKLHSFRTKPIYMFGHLVPRNHDQAMKLDEDNGNKNWKNAEMLELKQIQDYKTFLDKGQHSPIPPGYKKIRVHFVYAVKHDGCFKVRLVAGGHLTDTPVDSVYSSVVSLRGLRLVIFLGELNGLDTWATDIGNAYLESKTKEKVCIIAGPEFNELEGHTLVIVKALYGLRSSGLRWHERFADTLRDMGFSQSRAEDDIWIRRNGDVYEYMAIYVDDICIVAKDPAKNINILQDKYEYKLKNTGEISYHLGCDFFRDSTGTLCISPKTYIEKMETTYKRMFGCSPKPVSSPLENNDHPELDTSEELDNEDIKKYQSLIGALQWAVSIGRIDVTTAIMTMSGFRVAPRKGHLDRVKRIYGYLCKMRHACIRVRTEEPDYSDIPSPEYDWAYTAYGNVEEVLPKDAPEPLGKPVTSTCYVDANLYHDMTSGRSVTGILHLLNKTPTQWYSKKQGTVETATYGSELVAARIATEQVIELRLTLRYLGVPLNGKAYMFGDNKSVVDSSNRPHAKLHKRHTALSFHRVREAIASKMLIFTFIPGSINPADILSKHWANHKVWPMLQPLLFWQGNTLEVPTNRESNTDEDIA